MASNVVQMINDLATQSGTAAEQLNQRIGSLVSLTTTQKGNLVAAINEVAAAISSASGINDSITSTSATWSSSKINTEIATAITNLINGADTSSDTLKELADKVTALAQADNGLISAVAIQTFTELEKTQARENIGAAAASDIGDLNVDPVATFSAIYTG